ncbi:hypothetical protein LIER_10036 [Lithospermum erythrorhizon]|uniref:Reverse transcriptase domain-containing protein n=1 Tax=Lithospermum erythrorhizon TaxID=34254 RepID=A0AAV3PMT3_LITER
MAVLCDRSLGRHEQCSQHTEGKENTLPLSVLYEKSKAGVEIITQTGPRHNVEGVSTNSRNKLPYEFAVGSSLGGLHEVVIKQDKAFRKGITKEIGRSGVKGINKSRGGYGTEVEVGNKRRLVILEGEGNGGKRDCIEARVNERSSGEVHPNAVLLEMTENELDSNKGENSSSEKGVGKTLTVHALRGIAGGITVMWKLDGVVAIESNTEWFVETIITIVTYGNQRSWKHIFVYVSWEEIKRRHQLGEGGGGFVFDSRWVGKEGCEEIIKVAWAKRWWVLGGIRLEKKLRAYEPGGFSHEGVRSLEIELDQAWGKEEIYWKEKAKVEMLKERDRNTKYFHAAAMLRRRKNRIVGIKDAEGLWAFTCKEVRKTVFEMPADKSPRPDDMMEAEEKRALTGIKISRESPSISHILFIEDTMIFCKANAQEGAEVMRILGQYEVAYGQKINVTKCSVSFDWNTPLDVRRT